MAPTGSISFRDILARNIAARRAVTEPPYSQAGLADAVNSAGLDWTQSTVAGVETGRRQVTAEELLVLSRVLRTPVAALLDPGAASTVTVGREDWTASFVRQVASGDVADLDETDAESKGQPSLAEDYSRTMRAVALLAQPASDVLDGFASKWGLDRSDIKVRDFKTIVASKGPVESQSAYRVRQLAVRAGLPRSVHVEAPDVAAVAYRLWGTTYEVERERRTKERAGAEASARTLQAFRGHVVRQLDQELFEAMRSVLRIETKRRKAKKMAAPSNKGDQE